MFLDEFILFIINLVICLFYCIQTIRKQKSYINALEERVKLLEYTIEHVTM